VRVFILNTSSPERPMYVCLGVGLSLYMSILEVCTVPNLFKLI
jgi:hypothetical protein